MKRRDFIRAAGITAVGVGIASPVLANIPGNEHIPWGEIERVITSYGFDTYDLEHVESLPPGKDKAALKSWGKPDDLKVFYRILHKTGSQHHIGFERLENKEGTGKLTFVYLSFQKIHAVISESGGYRSGAWTEYPINRFYLDPQNWETELRETLSSGLSKTF